MLLSTSPDDVEAVVGCVVGWVVVGLSLSDGVSVLSIAEVVPSGFIVPAVVVIEVGNLVVASVVDKADFFFLTVTLHFNFFFPTRAVITAFPFFLALITPFFDTDTTDFLLDDHFTFFLVPFTFSILICQRI